MPKEDSATPMLRCHLDKTTYPNPRPTIELVLPPETHWRAAKAALYQVTAAVEIMTPEAEFWNVYCIDGHDPRRPGGTVYLQLARADAAEIARAMALLEEVVAHLQGPTVDLVTDRSAVEVLRRPRAPRRKRGSVRPKK